MKVDLEGAVLEQAHGARPIRVAAAAVDLGQDRVVRVLHADMHARRAELAQPPDLCDVDRVRPRLERQSDDAAPVRVRRVEWCVAV